MFDSKDEENLVRYTKWWEETKTSAKLQVERDKKYKFPGNLKKRKKLSLNKMKEIKSDIEDKWNTVEKFFS